eukprot:gb/GECG01009283.1/.p1 GENE.gb/GECG01009283.1/~~gb/GECG01009283.1/.p1  ORF type:complete len:411 (+),score=43.99 gb/GECG01009283.1/:1-1233(+)
MKSMSFSSVFVGALLVVCASTLQHQVDAAFCHGAPKPGANPNNHPIHDATPTMERSVKNGKAFRAGPTDYEFWVVHVYGTPYEMGYAHGSMMKQEVQVMADSVWQYFEKQIEDELSGLPTWLRDWVAEVGITAAVDLTWELTKNFTGDYFFEELHGLADGAGISYQKLRGIHMIGEVTQGKCSMYGSWGSASANGKTLQLRALDWDTDGPFKNYPAVVVYHPKDLGHDFANVGFLGWIGALTGQSSKQLAISEIGVSYPDSTFGQESRVGIPFTFLLRDILQFDNSYEDSINRITTANRTCDLILGVGDGNAGTFRGFEYSYSTADVFDDKNMRPDNSSWHPKISGMVYWGMDWDCPSYNEALAKKLQYYHGSLSPQVSISNITSVVQTGDVHLAVYDLTDRVCALSLKY